MSTLKAINLQHPSSVNNNIVLTSGGDVSVANNLITPNGNVAIKTTNPIASLEVNGSIVIANTLEPLLGYQGIGLLLNNQQTLPINNTASAQYYVGVMSIPRVGASNTGLTYIVGTESVPSIDSSNQSGRIVMSGQEIYAYRNSANDISTYATNGVWGLYIEAGHNSSLNANASTATVYGAQIVPENYRANVTSMYGVQVNGQSGGVVGANTTTTNFYSLYTNMGVGAASGVGTDTVTNYYDAYFGGATVAARGTLTNKYGVYQVKTDHTNYFAGPMTLANANVTIAGSNVLAAIAAGNTYAVSVGAASNTWANTTQGNAQAYTNAQASVIGVGANNQAGLMANASNSAAITREGYSNNWANTVAGYANTWANTKLSNTSGVSFAGNLYFPSGSLGVGTSNPRTQIEIIGPSTYSALTFNVAAGVANTRVYDIIASTSNTIGYRLVNEAYTAATTYYIINRELMNISSQIWYAGAGTEAFRIDNVGNLGIGTSGPAFKLDVNGNMKANSVYGSSLGDGILNLYSTSSSAGPNWTDAITFNTINAGKVLEIDSWGGMWTGIVPSPKPFNHSSASTTIWSYYDMSFTYPQSGFVWNTYYDSGIYRRITAGFVAAMAPDSSGAITFSTNNISAAANTTATLTPRLRIEANGNVSIGRTTATTYKLDVNGSINIASGGAIAGGFTVDSFNAGANIAAYGTWTPNPTNGNYQYVTSNGSVTIAVPTSNCAIDVLWYNGVSPGSVTFSGYQAASGGGGDSYLTTANYEYILSIRRINGLSTYVWKALQ